MSRAIILIVVVIATISGCSRYVGPLENRQKPPVNSLGPDGRPYNLDQQAVRARDKYSVPVDDFRVGPKIGFDAVDPTGRYYP